MNGKTLAVHSQQTFVSPATEREIVMRYQTISLFLDGHTVPVGFVGLMAFVKIKPRLPRRQGNPV